MLLIVFFAAEVHVPAGPIHRPRRATGPDGGGGADATAHRRHRAVSVGEAIGGNAAQVSEHRRRRRLLSSLVDLNCIMYPSTDHK